MKTKVEGEWWTIEFQYSEALQKRKSKPPRKVTTAYLHRFGLKEPSNDVEPLATYTGIVICHPTADTYNKYAGRRLAFENAMERFPGARWRKLRTALWELFLTTSRGLPTSQGYVRKLSRAELDAAKQVRADAKAKKKLDSKQAVIENSPADVSKEFGELIRGRATGDPSETPAVV